MDDSQKRWAANAEEVALDCLRSGDYDGANAWLRFAELQFKKQSAIAAVKERAKLEARTWFLRGSLAFNIAVIGGLVVRLAT